MLYLNVNDRIRKRWGRTIDFHHALNFSGLCSQICSINVLIDEESLPNAEGMLYRVDLTLVTTSQDQLSFIIEREDCGAAIEQSFAKAKRYLLRRLRGVHSHEGLRQLG